MTGRVTDAYAEGGPGPDPEEVWLALAGRVGLGESAAKEFWREIEYRYGEPGRHYHTLVHVRRLLSDWRRLWKELAGPEDVAMAVFYHDIIYDIPGDANEAKSALLARKHLSICRAGAVSPDRVSAMILATADHLPTDDADTNVFLDMDLAVLASDPADYQRYAEEVRWEHAVIAENTWRAGRMRFLKAFLARPFLYVSPIGRRVWEEPARSNLNDELERLL